MFFYKKAVEMAVIVKAAAKGNVLGALGGNFEIIFAFLQLFVVYILHGSHFVFTFKEVDNMVFGKMKVMAKIRKAYVAVGV